MIGIETTYSLAMPQYAVLQLPNMREWHFIMRQRHHRHPMIEITIILNLLEEIMICKLIFDLAQSPP